MNRSISVMARVFTKTRVQSKVEIIPKSQKIVVNASLLSTQLYKVWIKG